MPTDEEHAQLKALLHEAMDVGAGGWSVQRLRDSNVQRDHDGNPMNTDVMPNETLFQLAEVLAERNQGFVQATFAPDPADETRTEHRRTYERLADISGRPVLFNVITPNAQRPEQHLKQIEWVESCRLRGLPIYGQAVTTDVGLAFTFEEWNLWDDMEAWREATLGTVEERKAKLADPARRPALRDSESIAVTCPIADIVLLEASSPQYQGYAETRVGDIAADLGVHPVDAMLDIAVADDLAATFYASGSFNNPRPPGRLAELSVGIARCVRRRSPHPVPYSGAVAHRAAHQRGTRPGNHLAGGRPLAHGRTPGPMRRLHRPGNAHTGQGRGPDRLRPRQPGHRPQARRSTTCPPASGAEFSGPPATTTCWSTAKSPSKKTKKPAPPPAASCANAQRFRLLVWPYTKCRLKNGLSTIGPLSRKTFAEIGLKEREHLQTALAPHIQAISPDTLIVSEEFRLATWKDSNLRIDLLGIDKNADIVVIELKRTEEAGYAELQAIRYAALVATLTFEKVVDIYRDFLKQMDKGKVAQIPRQRRRR